MMGKETQYAHRKMIVWQNLDKIEQFIQQQVLARIPKIEYSLRDQIDRSCSSATANFIEGYYSGSIKEYLRFLGYSRRSLAELQYWIRRSHQRSYLSVTAHSEFEDMSIKTIYLLNRLISALHAKRP
jgi:four helix bundle protein